MQTLQNLRAEENQQTSHLYKKNSITNENPHVRLRHVDFFSCALWGVVQIFGKMPKKRRFCEDSVYIIEKSKKC